jgi:hypothetical protein
MGRHHGIDPWLFNQSGKILEGVRRLKTITPDFVRFPASKIRPAAGFALAWTFLNALMNIKYPAEAIKLQVFFKLSPEVLVVMAALSTATWMGLRLHSAGYLTLTAFILFLRLFRLGDILVPMYFFRPFNLYLDSQFLPDLIHLLYTTSPERTFVVAAILAAMLLAGISWGIWLALKTIHNYLSNHLNHRWGVALLIAFLVMHLFLPAGGIGSRPALFTPSFFHRVVEEFDFILHVKGYRKKHLDVIDAAIRKGNETPSSLDRLKGASVYLFFVESYGQTIFADKRHFQKIRPFLNNLERSLIARKFSIYSSFFKSPTYGGTSWLAHAALAGGVHLKNQMDYNLLITSKTKTIAKYFNAAGYRTISVMPGTQWPWPEGAFFGYQQKYYAWNFDYKGPPYGWSTMPDQYVLEYIYRREIRERTKPLFIEFILGSSHAPFHLQPPFLKDWSQIADGAVYNKKQAVTFPVVWPDLSNASEAFVTAIIYELNVITGFIKRYVNDNTLIIFLGDHQPNVQITGKDRPWSVPVHVVSRNRELVEPFRKRGYTPGLVPIHPPPHRGMETFLYEFLLDFSSRAEPCQSEIIISRALGPQLNNRSKAERSGIKSPHN